MTFLPDRLYPLIRLAFANLVPCAITGDITEDSIMIALAEYADIVPLSIAADLIRTSVEEAEIVGRKSALDLQ